MTATVSVGAMAEQARWRWAAVIASVVAIGALVIGGSSVRADQTVYFDDAGNAPHISLIGDSTLTGVRWYADYGALERFNFVLSAESCRRTIEQSCVSREGYRSANVIRAMRTLDGELGEVLVVMSGYNDPVGTIDEAIAGVVDEARDQGVGHVVWLSLRTSEDVDYSDPQHQSSINTFRVYNEELVAAAAASGGYLQVADWATHSHGAPSWFEADGVHLTRLGVDGSPRSSPGWWSGCSPERTSLRRQPHGPCWCRAPRVSWSPACRTRSSPPVSRSRVAPTASTGTTRWSPLPSTSVAAMACRRRVPWTWRPPGRSASYADPQTADEATARRRWDRHPRRRPSPPRPCACRAAGDEPVDSAHSEAGSGLVRWPLVAVTVIVGLVAGVVGRRRHVVAQRSARRWARVHPSTSPRWSVADRRRAGERPGTGPTGRVYDHEQEEPVVLEEVADADCGRRAVERPVDPRRRHRSDAGRRRRIGSRAGVARASHRRADRPCPAGDATWTRAEMARGHTIVR